MGTIASPAPTAAPEGLQLVELPGKGMGLVCTQPFSVGEVCSETIIIILLKENSYIYLACVIHIF